MRYVRFLKTPRVAHDKDPSKSHIYLLVTITTDLGDSFLTKDIELSAELWTSQPSERVLVWRALHWKDGMRSLPITLPLRKSYAHLPFRIRVGVEPKSNFDEWGKFFDESNDLGVISAWSAEFNIQRDAAKFVERRFKRWSRFKVGIWEETGESIARHLWDAGLALSCNLSHHLGHEDDLTKALLPHDRKAGIHVLELGTGCGIVGITIAGLLEETNAVLTDLLEAQEIVQRNIEHATLAKGSSLRFQELNWEDDLPGNLQHLSSPLDLVVAADCTYNPDSSPALVKTLVRLAETSPNLKIGIAMKRRHLSEEIFFELMAEAKFKEIQMIEFPTAGLYWPNDEPIRRIGERERPPLGICAMGGQTFGESILLYIYKFKPTS